MDNKLLESAAYSLGLEFEDKYPIYMEEIKQNFERPSLFIRVENPKICRGLSNRKKYISTVVIQFFPKDHKKNRTMNDMAQRIIDSITYLRIGDKMLHGYNIKNNKSGGVGVSGLNTQYEAVDGVLNISVDYAYRCVSENTEDKGVMEKLELRKGLD